MSKKRFVSIVALILVLVISFTGCAQEAVSPKEQQPANQPTETPQEDTKEVDENEKTPQHMTSQGQSSFY